MIYDDDLDTFECFEDNGYLEHYGTPRHSGRYPWGSGDNPYQSTKTFHSMYNELHRMGLTDREITDQLLGPDHSINELKAKRSISTQMEKHEQGIRVMRLRKKGYGWTEIAKKLDLPNESSVRSIYDRMMKPTKESNMSTADKLESILKDKGGYLDISRGTEIEMGITANKLMVASKILQEKGYEVHTIDIKQITMPGKYTTTKVLAPPGTTKKEIIQNLIEIHSVETYSPDGGTHWFVPQYPKPVDRSRVQVRWVEEGGKDKDGIIELRPGVKDLSLGNSSYAQVRIAVDNCDVPDGESSLRYAKGVAVYGKESDFPPGIDIIINSNKSIKKGDVDALKEIKDTVDADLAFGAKIKAGGQYEYVDDNGNTQLASINKVNDEGDWQNWSKTLSSQFLSKQSNELIKSQLNLTYADYMDRYNDIMSLTNPVVKQKQLEEFASLCDSASVDLKAMALPRQQSHVLIPVNSLKENEIFAPNYKNGEEVILVRYPHGGIYEIPRLIVNNKNKEGKEVIGTNAPDAVGINSVVGGILSGADYDGDTVLVIPTSDKVRINTKDPLPGLKGFDPSEAYPEREGMTYLTKDRTQMEMGIVSNLITDMTLKGATDDELARAVRHSMVIIDAAKHKLDYKQSEIDNNIDELKRLYQQKPNGRYGGASTLISLASSEAHILEREIARTDEEGNKHKSWKPNAETGAYEYRETGRTIRKYQKDKDGNVILDADGNPVFKEVPVKTKMKKMQLVEDAHELSSGTVQEELYADYANHMKHLANESRKEAMALSKKMPKKNPDAEEIYKVEVESLNEKLKTALKNAPKERQALIIANTAMRQIFDENPNLDKDEIKKMTQKEMRVARAKVGANKKDVQVQIEPKEWEAIQNNAISPSKLRLILDNADSDKVKKLASPQINSNKLPTAKINKLKAMANAGYTNQEIAEQLGISTSSVYNYLTE